MSVVAALYPPHRRPTGDRCPGCPDPLRLLVCLPPTTNRHPFALLDAVRERLRPHAASGINLPDIGHVPWWRPADLAATDAHQRAHAVRQARDWALIVGCTPPAQPWSHFLDAHHIDPEHYPLARAIAQFERQPRITALATTVGSQSGADMYGPGLEALQQGAGCFAGYRAGVVVFADGLLTLDGRLLTPSFSPLLVEQTLDEREAFHEAARGYLAAAHPATALVAVRCLRYPTVMNVASGPR